MKLIKRGEKLDRIWRGRCRQCGSEFEDTDSHVRTGEVYRCPREGEELAHRTCPECKAPAGGAVILYPVKP